LRTTIVATLNGAAFSGFLGLPRDGRVLRFWVALEDSTIAIRTLGS
jgi:hypothetical protein